MRIFILLVLLNFINSKANSEAISKLKLKKLHSINPQPITDRGDFSGLANDGKNIFTISDQPQLNHIYKINFKNNADAYLSIAHQIDANWISNYAKDFKTKKADLDFEGIALCNGSFYIANERRRTVIKLTPPETIPEEIIPDFATFHKKTGIMNPFSGIKNAGLEAITCHQDNLYLFNERQYRMAYTYSLSQNKLINQFDIPSIGDLPRKESIKWNYPDFTGADYQNNHLFLLERNTYSVAKVSLDNYKVVKRYSFKEYEKTLFHKKENFGLAEGLTIMGDSLFILLDNNDDKRQSDNTTHPYLFEFDFKGEF